MRNEKRHGTAPQVAGEFMSVNKSHGVTDPVGMSSVTGLIAIISYIIPEFGR